jgi:hypothetical protein
MNPAMSNQMARERTRDLLASRNPRDPRAHARTHGLISRLRAARSR